MKLKNEREYEEIDIFNIYPLENLDTLNTTEEELWLLLERLTNRYEANEFLYSTLGHKKGLESEISPMFSEFIKQGKLYYQQAEKADCTVSPLLYYYAMLNLVKAYILSRDPDVLIPKKGKTISGANLSHGISAGDKIKREFSIFTESIELQNNGIFSHYYKILSGKSIKSINAVQKKIPITNLLSYCLDISSEFEDVFKKKKNTVPAVFQIAKNKKQAWIRFVINSDELKKKSLSGKRIFNRNPALNQYQRVASKYNKSAVFEEKTTFSFSNNKNLQSQIQKRVKTMELIFSINSKSSDYRVPLIDNKDKNFLFPEILNIYLMMYYLGSIVRYQPYAYKKVLPYKEGWVIQSFIRTCPKKFLRLMVASMFEKFYVFN